MLTEPGGPFIDVTKMNLVTYAQKPALAKVRVREGGKEGGREGEGEEGGRERGRERGRGGGRERGRREEGE